MKRIILGLSLLLMLVQNGFAMSDAEFDKRITNATDKIWKQMLRCYKAVENHEMTSEPKVCIETISLIENNKNHSLYSEKSDLLLKAGLLYYQSKKNYIKAYEYWMKAAKLGNTVAQGNLDILCRNHSWVCK